MISYGDAILAALLIKTYKTALAKNETVKLVHAEPKQDLHR